MVELHWNSSLLTFHTYKVGVAFLDEPHTIGREEKEDHGGHNGDGEGVLEDRGLDEEEVAELTLG